MHISPFRRGMYDHQADRIEKALSSLSLPTRVQGGVVGREHVRFHLAPLPDMTTSQVKEIASRVAEAMGVYKVQVDEREEGWVLDLPLQDEFSLRLLPLIQSLNNLLPLTTVPGIATSGKPVLLNLRRCETWHIFVHGQSHTGKSELLRTFILSLALKNRPSQVQFLGIDFSGKELTVIDALPHALSEVAIDTGDTDELVHWLVDEIERRLEARIIYPDLILIIDELERVIDHSEILMKKLPLILRDGIKAGVHLIASSGEIRPGPFMPNWRRSGVVVAKARKGTSRTEVGEAEQGQFEFQFCGEKIVAQVAWLPVRDLQQAVTMVRTGWRSKKDGMDLKALWK
jgi:DNA segregation ATPase FtsK/SpoIIIE-like protein